MITVKSNKMSYGINFPTSLTELTPDVFNTITDGVKLPKHYCVVALAFKTKIFDFCTMINSNKQATIGVTPILAKISDDDSKDINAVVGDKIIIDRSSLERGVQIKFPILISSENARNYFNNDPNIVKAIMTKDNRIIQDSGINKQLISSNYPDIIILEFKIVPVNDISAAIPVNYKNIDPFKAVDIDAN